MSSRSRLVVLLVSAPIVLLVVVGGFLSKAIAREDSYQHLRVFEDVVSLILNNYVEDVDSSNVMRGAMHGLADGLDPDSAYLTPAQVATFVKGDAGPRGSVGLELTRQYYLRVIAALEGSPAAKAGLRPGDFVRAIDDKPTRDMSVVVGSQLLRGEPGSKVTLTVIRGNAAEPHTITLVRELPTAPAVTSRLVEPRVGLVRVPAFTPETPAQVRDQVAALSKQGVEQVLVDVRGTAEGKLDDGVAAARLFVASGVLATRETRAAKTPLTAQAGDGSITTPVTILVDHGTAGAAELFAAALWGNGRATLVGERTVGRAAAQELVRLPDGGALWLTTSRYLTPKDAAIHEKGLTPDVVVDPPDVEFGETPASDVILEKALEKVAPQSTSLKKAA